MTEAGAGFEVDVGVHIGAAVGRAVAEALADHRRAEQRRRAWLNSQIMPLSVDPIPIQLAAGAGTLDAPRLLGPALGWVFQLDGMGAQGFTAGTVSVWASSVAGQGANVFTFTAAGVFYQRHFRYLRYGERLTFQASGITGTAAIWVAGLAYTEDIQGEVHV